MSKKDQRLSWEIRNDFRGFIDIFPFEKPDEIIMSISLSEAIQAAKKKNLGIVVDRPSISFKLRTEMKKSDRTVLTLTSTEALAFAVWVKSHLASCEYAKEHGNKNVDFHFETSSVSGIGQNTYVTCSCGIKEEITDAGSW
jgi:hypothetical protein